ncbi:hypothetical protein ACQ4PT_047142 [Festuca glaucescens]
MGAVISTFILALGVEEEEEELEEVIVVHAAVANASGVEAQGTVAVGEGVHSGGADAMAAFDHVGVRVQGPGLDKERDVAGLRGVGAAVINASGVGKGALGSAAEDTESSGHVTVAILAPDVEEEVAVTGVQAQGIVAMREGVRGNGPEAVESSDHLALNVLATGVQEGVNGAGAGVANANGVQAPVLGEEEVIGVGPGGSVSEAQGTVGVRDGAEAVQSSDHLALNILGHGVEEEVNGAGAGFAPVGPGGNVSEVIILTIGSQGTAIVAAIKKGVREVSASTADSYKVAYLLAIAAVFVASLAQLLGAIWVSYNTRERGAAGKKILYASVVTLVFGILLDAIACLLKK